MSNTPTADQPVIVWFTNDLRLNDNAALTKAVASERPVIPVYIYDESVPSAFAFGGAIKWWLHQSLTSLSVSLAALGGSLILRRGNPTEILQQLISETSATAVYFSRNYAPWSGELETSISQMCTAAGIDCKRFSGFLLHEPEDVRTGSGGPYKVYTPFSRACFATETDRAPKPAPSTINFYASQPASDSLNDWTLYEAKPDWAARFGEYWTPGEAGAAQKLERFLRDAMAAYTDNRNLPGTFSTSRLSPHLHFGEISPLQCWYACRHQMQSAAPKGDQGGTTFLKELLWREFSYHLLHHWPKLPQKPFKPEFEGFPWSDNQAALEAWRRGQTGIPIVDAGMRELWATGWMHNRVRMIVASFLTKNLLVPWQEGERWFWDTLVDADIGSNSASWQWVAGCGADAAPYFRIFNPVLQGEKFDPDGVYVCAWVPELANLPKKYIHKPDQAPPEVLSQAGIDLGSQYPHPIADLKATREAALAAYDTIRKSKD